MGFQLVIEPILACPHYEKTELPCPDGSIPITPRSYDTAQHRERTVVLRDDGLLLVERRQAAFNRRATEPRNGFGASAAFQRRLTGY